MHEIMRQQLGTQRVPLKANHDIVDGTAPPQPSDRAGFGTKTIRRPTSARAVAHTMVGASRLINSNRPASARSTMSLASNYTTTSRGTNILKQTYDGDILNKHADKFNEPVKPFTPRTLKSNRESSLKRYKYYTPPPSRKSSSSHRKEEEEGRMTMTMNGNDDMVLKKPAAKPRAKPRQPAPAELEATGTLSESMLMDMSMRSHGKQSSGGENTPVPRLDITMDKDHMQWVKDQADRAQKRKENTPPITPGDGGDTLGHTATSSFGDKDTLRFTRTGSTLK